MLSTAVKLTGQTWNGNTVLTLRRGMSIQITGRVFASLIHTISGLCLDGLAYVNQVDKTLTADGGNWRIAVTLPNECEDPGMPEDLHTAQVWQGLPARERLVGNWN